MALHGPIWLVIGIALCVTEIFLPSFTILWFGLGAIIVALLTFLIPSLSLAAQIGIWAVLTTVFAVGWFRFFKPLMYDRTKAGLSREAAVGQIGMIVKAGGEHVRGTVRFSVPLLGAEEWPYICENTLGVGDRCRVVDILGNALLVERH
jgi:membrane protein implicated in regulation of membrane protease activity